MLKISKNIVQRHIKTSKDTESTHFLLQPGGKRWIWEAIQEAVDNPDYFKVQYRNFQAVVVLTKLYQIPVGYRYEDKKRPLYAITVVYHEMMNKVITAYPERASCWQKL